MSNNIFFCHFLYFAPQSVDIILEFICKEEEKNSIDPTSGTVRGSEGKGVAKEMNHELRREKQESQFECKDKGEERAWNQTGFPGKLAYSSCQISVRGGKRW